MEVIKVFDRPASTAFYSVAGRLLFIESNNLELSNLLEQLFSGWQLTPVSLPQRSPDVRISFNCSETQPAIPRDLNSFEIAEGGKCYTDGADFHLAIGEALVQLKSGSPIAVTVWLKELPAARDPLLARVGSFAVCAALRRYGLFDLHSAGVVKPGSDVGVVIVGPSGSGKSTLALQLVRSGWPYLSDDELLLSWADGVIEARGFRSFFAVSRDKSEPFKDCFEPAAVFGSQRIEKALPRVLLFVRLSDNENSNINKLTQAETMTRLIRACPWATYDTSIAGANLGLLSALACQANGFELSAGRNLLEPGYASLWLTDALFSS
jgi:hypothetical protein